ncbi:MAG TPA: ABC transporter permease [Actinomycetota bacterium]|nr:ABC transporter permease [Actinomycetota bacterium]
MSVVVERRRARPLQVSLAGAWRYWLRNAAVFRRTWLLGLMAWFLEPVIYLVAMGLGLGQYLEQIRGIDYIDFIAPGLAALSAMYGATFEATWSAHFKMERAGIYGAATATPVSIEDVALGEAMWAATRAGIYGAAFCAVALPFGVFHSWWALAVPPVLLATGFMFGVMGIAYTYHAKRIDYLAYYWTLFLTPMFMFSGIFFPLDRLPEWIQTLAWFMPLHHAVEAMRSLMLDGDPIAASMSTLWMIALSLALLPLPLRALRRRLT